MKSASCSVSSVHLIVEIEFMVRDDEMFMYCTIVHICNLNKCSGRSTGNYDRPTDQASNRLTDQAIDQQTNMRVYREVTLPTLKRNG